ncbi:MAG: glycosyltransferase family 2 protein [Acidimicrobiales bacterium]
MTLLREEAVAPPTEDPEKAEDEPRSIGEVIVLIPAHNEEEAIEETLISVHNQTRPVDRIIVVCDNCTDRTEEIIEPLDCETMRSKDNSQKKAGALNQALAPLYRSCTDSDRVLVMDADSILDERFVEAACAVLDGEPQVGAVSAAYIGKRKPGFLPMLQRIEYVHERRRVARRMANVRCLSGTAVLFNIGALRHLLRERGKSVPGQVDKPEAYLSVSLTEDFEITLALKMLGYKPISPKQCVTYTDVMPTIPMLWSQRLRWQRGTLETLRLYGLSKLTLPLILVQIYTYAMSLATPLMVVLWMTALFVLHSGLEFKWWILALLPLSAIEQFVTTLRLREWKASVAATTIITMWLYDNLKCLIYWHALIKLLKREEFIWE